MHTEQESGMPWEWVGRQELSLPGPRSYVYLVDMWRAAVPGGWLVVSLNAKSNSPDPVTAFYPDPDHAWTPRPHPESRRLLRPAGGAHADDHLLQPADPND